MKIYNKLNLIFVLFICCFAVIIALPYFTDDGIKSFKSGFWDGYNAAKGIETKEYSVDRSNYYYVEFQKCSGQEYSFDNQAENVSIKAMTDNKVHSIIIESAESLKYNFYNFMVIVCGLLGIPFIVLLVMFMRCIYRSIKNKLIFSESLYKHMLAISIIYPTLLLMSVFGYYFDYLWISHYIQNSELVAHFNYIEFLKPVGIFFAMFFISEIFKVGYQLQEEQNLTV